MDEPTNLDIALRAARAGSAGHWPAVADVLADEVERLRPRAEYAERSLAEVSKGLAPLCPCVSLAMHDGPQQECPLHGDYVTFVAHVQHLERVKARAAAFRVEAYGSSTSRASLAYEALRAELDGERTAPPVASFDEPAGLDAVDAPLGRAREVAEANTTSPIKSTNAIDAARYILGETQR